MFEDKESTGLFWFIVVLAYLITALIWFAIIHYAVKSAVANFDNWNRYYWRENNRLLSMMLINQGMKASEIRNLLYVDDDTFWSEMIAREGAAPKNISA